MRLIHEFCPEDPSSQGLPNFTRYLGAPSTAPGDVATLLNIWSCRRLSAVNGSDHCRTASCRISDPMQLESAVRAHRRDMAHIRIGRNVPRTQAG